MQQDKISITFLTKSCQSQDQNQDKERQCLTMEFKTKKQRHQKERNIADEECDSVAAVLMGVETVQNFLKK